MNADSNTMSNQRLLEAICCSVDGWLTMEEANFLMAAAAGSAGHVVNIGTYHGRSSLVLATGLRSYPDRLVYTVDPHNGVGTNGAIFKPSDLSSLYTNLLKWDQKNKIRILSTTSSRAANCLSGEDIGLLFVDADHSATAVQSDLYNWSLLLTDRATVACHDSDLPGVREGIESYISILSPDRRPIIQQLGSIVYWEYKS